MKSEMKSDNGKYPECVKVREAKPYSQKIGLFMEWLLARGVELAVPHHHTEECLFEDQELRKMQKKDKFGQWKLCLGDFHEGELIPYYYNMEKLLAEFFGIDLNKYHDEQGKVLEDFRKAQNAHKG